MSEKQKIKWLLAPVALVAVSLLTLITWRAIAPDTTPPSVPEDLTVSAASFSQINLTWTASTDNAGVKAYRIYRNGQQVATSASTSYLDGGLTTATEYSYAVTAYDEAGNVSAQSATASAATQSPTLSPAYPLKVSPNHRYFVDQNNVPVLVIGDAPQSLGGQLNRTQQTTYFSDRQAHGFNAAWINLLCTKYTACRADGKTSSGVIPFTSGSGPSTYDLSTPNESYFALYDATVNLAASHGIIVFLDPIETGGWLTTLRNNGLTKAFNYGVYVGKRYRNFPNIIWMSGNDFANYIVSSDNALVGQVMAGIASVDSNHLQTIELDPTNKGNTDNYSNQDTALSAYYGADIAYSYAPTYNVVLNAFNSSPTTPVVLGEGNYEFENNIGYSGGATDAYLLRETAYWTLTSGGIGGYLYGSKYSWRSTWISDPATLLYTPGATQIAYINKLFNGIQWWNLVPDQSHAVVTAGYGTYTTGDSDPRDNTYCSTAASADRRLALAYCPAHATLTVAMSTFSGVVTARWYDPSNGTFTPISGSPFANSGSHDFTMPGNNADGDPDWVLLLQAEGPTAS
jgi:Protein of unknown function (DUF4038)/Putative collagen-binding domain of a collagenase/Fibronectin type III domain